ncbi:MAG: C40 family peptidase [Burkholderiales bacterium]|jgi:cell wall-associated NlpC family hydrolase|nr:C40 family peptidase [Burkholderiales bacterium]
MSKWLLIFLFVCASAQAAPPSSPGTDTMDNLLGNNGVITQIGGQLDQVRQTVSDKASELVANAMGFLGVPYKYGGTSTESGGFDCSGFVRTIYEQTLGLVLPRRASQQAAATEVIKRKDLQPGDLVFFNTMRRAFSHVGIYIGNGKFIHAPRTGGEIRVEDMDLRYWRSRFDGARRVETASRDNTATVPSESRSAELVPDPVSASAAAALMH